MAQISITLSLKNPNLETKNKKIRIKNLKTKRVAQKNQATANTQTPIAADQLLILIEMKAK